MIAILKARLRLGKQTVAYPDGPARFPERFRGRPVLDPARCVAECTSAPPSVEWDGSSLAPAPAGERVGTGGACAAACPTEAIAAPGRSGMSLDLGRCVFCADCVAACPAQAITFTRDYRLAMNTRAELLVRGDEAKLARALDERMRSLFGRSLRLRQVSAGGCNGCEAELNASGNIQFDLSRFGVQFVASPRHADGLVVTGPVTENMLLALRKTYEATPAPKIVVAVGACAISGGAFRGSAAAHDGVDGTIPGVPVDLYIPGCPPHPITVLDGLLRVLGRVAGDRLQLADTGIAGPADPVREAAPPSPAAKVDAAR